MVVAFGQRKSISKVVAVIQSCKGISQKEIIAATGLSERTVKYALKELVSRRLARSMILLNDTRKKVYYAEARK